MKKKFSLVVDCDIYIFDNKIYIEKRELRRVQCIFDNRKISNNISELLSGQNFIHTQSILIHGLLEFRITVHCYSQMNNKSVGSTESKYHVQPNSRRTLVVRLTPYVAKSPTLFMFFHTGWHRAQARKVAQAP